MNKKEEEFSAKLYEIFKVEAEEHLKNLSDGLVQLETKLEKEKEKEIIESIFREAHSLKGAARSVLQNEIQGICQSMEDLLDGLKKEKLKFSAQMSDILYEAIDAISNVLKDQIDNEKLLSLIQQMDEMSKKENVEPPLEKKVAQEEVLQPSIQKEPEIIKESLPKSLSEKKGLAAHKESTESSNKTIRVSLSKLDKLMQEVEEMLMLKLASRKQVNELQNLKFEVDQWDKKWNQAEKEIHSLRGLIEEEKFTSSSCKINTKKMIEFCDWQQSFMKSIGTKLNELIKMATQDHRLASSIVDLLLEDTKKILMQPLSMLFESFPRMVRDISHSLNKNVHIEFFGGDIEVDRRILEEIKDPLIHIIRNSIDHGIENEQERKSKGKAPSGLIQISASQVSGNRVELIITDDGKGVDIEKVKQKAVEQKIFSKKEVEALKEKEILDLIFLSGVSTQNKITELSGRGLGLVIVTEKVDKLGGHLFVETKENQGTTFKILLPLTQATFRGIHIKASKKDYIIPTHNVKRVIRLKKGQVKTVENRATINIDDKSIALVGLSEILKLEREEKREDDLIYAIVIKVAEKTMAFSVDEVVNEQEVLVKTLGKELQQVKNLLAATVTEWGQVIPILNPQDLVKSAIVEGEVKLYNDQEQVVEEKKTILIAEDSITSRMLLKNILEGAGYIVKATVDGAEALAAFKEEKFDLVLSDIEMPRMDGLTLTKKIRESEKGKNLPIVLCTSRGSKEDREKGIEVGANAYLDKNTFTQGNLLNAIKRLL